MPEQLYSEHEQSFTSDNLHNGSAEYTHEQEIRRTSTPNQRLALAIISMFFLLMLTLSTLGFLTNGGHTISWPALILASVLISLFCIAITVINAVFNIAR